MNNSNFRLALSGLALGVLLALLIAPQTRWLVRLQVLTVLHQYHPLPAAVYTTSEANDLRLFQAAAARHPDDFLLQYGLATSYPDDQAVLNLRALKKHFPDRPELFANILRYESREMNFDRLDGSPLSEQVARGTPRFAAIPPANLAAYDREASEGEKLDPDNAYFPLMRAHGLLAVHRDSEALAAVQRASVKPLWREYLLEDDEAHWYIHTAAFGDPGGLGQVSLTSRQALWQLSRSRQTARLAVYQAVLKEQAGHPEEGLALREAVRRCGDLMRTQSTLLIGALVGTAISAISQTRPGGVPYPADTTGLPHEQKAQLRLDTYCAYVTKIGHPEAARRARDEETARRSVRILGAMDWGGPFPDWSGPVVRLTLWWVADIAVILNIGWLVFLSFLAAWRARKPFAEKPRLDLKSAAMQVTTALGLWLVVALFGIFVGYCWVVLADHVEFSWQGAFGEVGVLGLVLWLVGRTLRRMTAKRPKAVLITAGIMPIWVGVIYGLYWLIVWQAGTLAEIPEGMRLLTQLSRGSTDSDTEQALQVKTLWLCTAATLTVPVFLAVIVSITALIRRIPFAQTLVSGFHRFALPAACLLLLVYGGLLAGTVRQDRIVRNITLQANSNGGHYYASLSGEKWPGPVR